MRHGKKPFNRSLTGGNTSRRVRWAVECSPLESRTYFDAVYPTPNEQYLLELINRARASSPAEVQRQVAAGAWPTGAAQNVNEGLPDGTISTSPAQPLAMNPYLLDASRKHTQYLFANPNVTDPHAEVINGVTVNYSARDIAAGYPVSMAGGENIWTAFGNPANDNPTADMQALEAGTFIDYVNGGTPGRGHRVNMLNPGANEVGLGLGMIQDTSSGTSFPEYIVTEDYANAGTSSFLCGITYNDQNQDQFYEPGEELPNVTITATNTSNNQTFSTTTWASGGYSLALAPGTYLVSASGGNIGTPATQTVTIGNQNVEADFIAANTPPAAPAIVTQPQNVSTYTSDTMFSFSVTATGSPVPTVQWQVAPFGSTSFTNIPGATNYTYSAPITPDLNANQYRAVLTNSQGSVTTNAVTLTIPNGNVIPINVTQPPLQNQNVNAGDTVTFTSAATGFSTVQWEYSTNGGVNPQPIPGATSLNYSFTATPDQTGNLFLEHLANPTTSVDEPAFINVNAAPAAPAITAQPQNQVAANGGNATLAVAATGFPAPAVQWQDVTPTPAPALARSRAASSGTFQNISGGNGPTLSVPAPANGKSAEYRAVITNGNGSVTTQTITVRGNTRSALSDDVLNLRTASKAALAAISVCKNATHAVATKLSADLKRLKASASAQALLKKLVANELTSRLTFTKDENALLNRLNGLAAKISGEAAKARTSPSVATRLQADLSALSAAATTNAIPADATACKLATTSEMEPLSAIAPTDLQLQNDVVAAQTNAYNIGQALQAPVTLAQVVVDRVEADATT